MNMGMAYDEWQEKLERLHRESVHDDGCATVYPGGVCNCTKRAIRTGAPHPRIPMGGALASQERKAGWPVSNQDSESRPDPAREPKS